MGIARGETWLSRKVAKGVTLLIFKADLPPLVLFSVGTDLVHVEGCAMRISNAHAMLHGTKLPPDGPSRAPPLGWMPFCASEQPFIT